MGRTWTFIIKYIIPVQLILIWVSGIAGLFNGADLFEIGVDLFISLVVVGLSILLTKLKPAKN